MSEYCKQCDDELFGDWLPTKDGEFCNYECEGFWSRDQIIEQLRTDKLDHITRNLNGECICPARHQTKATHYPGCPKARITISENDAKLASDWLLNVEDCCCDNKILEAVGDRIRTALSQHTGGQHE